jgi:hypothetical protein
MAANNYYLEFLGSQAFPRFLITKGADPTFYWTGSEWVERREKALLYSCADDAQADLNKFRVKDYGPCIKSVFQMPMTVEVYAHKPVELEDLRAWLKKALNLYVDVKTNSDGPNDSLAFTSVDLASLSKAAGES